MRPLTATIDLSALRHNFLRAKAYAPNAKHIAVVKANGYGHGLINAARGLQAADMFAVLRIEEAVQLREAGFLHPILLLEGVFEMAELHEAAQLGLHLVVHDEQQLQMLESTYLKRSISVFLKLNSGMNRLGFKPDRYFDAVQRIAKIKYVHGIVTMTHFATADDERGIASQFVQFETTTAPFSYPKSMANSAAIIRYPQAHADYVRPGIMLYGSSPFADVSAKALHLKPVMQLASKLIGVQALSAGESVGYGQTFVADKPMRVGVVACGYADGYPRHAGTGTPVAVDGVITRTLGRVSMDMLCADITDIPEAEAGSHVELWGEYVSVDAVAASAGTIGYELLCALAPRVPIFMIE